MNENPMNKKLFLQSLNSLESAFGEKVSEDRAKIYWDILRGYSDMEMKKAVIGSIRELKFFPKISEIIEMIEGSSSDEPELAYLEFRKKLDDEGSYMSVSFPKYPAISATIEALGGWIRISDTLMEDEKWLKIEFKKLYPIMKRRGSYPEELTGRFELENSNKGYTEKSMLDTHGRLLDGSKVKGKKLLEGRSARIGIIDLKNKIKKLKEELNK